MFTAVKDFLRRRPVPGLATSVFLHVLVVALLVFGGLPMTRHTAKRGEPIIVELPELRDSPPPGQPSRPSSGVPARERPSRPPTKIARSAPSPDTARSAVAAAKPAPPTPEPPEPNRTPAPTPQPTTPDPTAEPGPAPHAAPPPAAQSAPTPAAPPAPPQVAAIPPSVVDIRSALRRGAGGSGEARGGITGEPIPLDSSDPRFSEYLEQVRRQIQAKMVYPCVRELQTGLCEPKTTSLFLHFGILKSGQLQFVDVVKGSPWEIYDDYSMNAIKLASPFPPIPAAIMATLDRGTTGMPIMAHFIYKSEVSFRPIAR